MNVLLVDDHPLILTALKAIVEGISPDIRTHCVTSGAEARAALQRQPGFDIVLLDIGLDDCDGFDLLVELHEKDPSMQIVVVSAVDRTADVIRAIDLGAVGFVPKRSSTAELTEALQMVMTGGLYVPAVMDFGRAARQDDGVQEACPPMQAPTTSALRPPPSTLEELGLTPRQRQVLDLLLRAQSNKLIARELNLSVETVKDHVAAVLRALGVSSRTQALFAVSQMMQARRKSPVEELTLR